MNENQIENMDIFDKARVLNQLIKEFNVTVEIDRYNEKGVNYVQSLSLEGNNFALKAINLPF